jgi:aryl-alcohol dehydrogenase-like predicted oxidoreductase
VRFLGLSPAHRYGLDVARAAIASGVFDGLMLTYNVTSPPATEEVIEQAARAGIAVLAKLPLGRAIFDRSWRRVRSRADLWYVLRGLRTMRRAVLGSRKYGFLNEVEGSTAAQVALRYVLDNPNVTSAVPGTVKLQHLRQNIAVSQSPPLSGELTERIRRAAA